MTRDASSPSAGRGGTGGSPRHRPQGVSARLRSLLAAAFAATVVCGAGAGAWASDLGTAWDGPILSLTWNGETTSTYADTFVGGPVSIPGDESWRTLHVVNSSDCAGLVTVEAYDVLAEVPPDSVNDILPEIIELVWHIDGIGGAQTFADIISSGGTRQLASFILPRGQDKQVSIGYQFPWKETRGRNMGFPSTGLTFNMRITAEGDARSCDLDPRTTTLAPIVPPGGPGTGGAGGAGGAGAAGDPGAPGRADAVGVSGSSNDSANAQVQNPGFGGYGGAAPPGAAAWTPNSTTVDPLDIALIATLAIGLALLAFAVITHHRHRKLHPHP